MAAECQTLVVTAGYPSLEVGSYTVVVDVRLPLGDMLDILLVQNKLVQMV